MSQRCRINSYRHRVDVATSRRFSRCKKLALPGTSLSSSFGDMNTASVRHACDVGATCTRNATSYRDKQQHLYDFVRVMFDLLTTLLRVLANCIV